MKQKEKDLLIKINESINKEYGLDPRTPITDTQRSLREMVKNSIEQYKTERKKYSIEQCNTEPKINCGLYNDPTSMEQFKTEPSNLVARCKKNGNK